VVVSVELRVSIGSLSSGGDLVFRRLVVFSVV